MANGFAIIERQKPLPPITGRGRKKGSGVNLKLLASLNPGDSIWDVDKKKMMSIRCSAQRAGIKISIRKIPETDKYAIARKE